MPATNIAADIFQVRRIYDSGVPFFTKQALRDVVRQLEGNKNNKVVITGLDGKEVEFRIETGKVLPAHSPVFDSFESQETSTEAVWRKVTLRYYTIHHLTIPENHRLRPENSYLTIGIGYAVDFRNSRTRIQVTRIPRMPSIDHVRYRYAMEKNLWQESVQGSELLYTLSAVPQLPPISKIVAFACGSLTWDDEGGTRNARQHAVVLSLRQFLKDKQQRLILPCLIQDPEYMDWDRQLLQDQDGMVIVDDPEGFLEVDDQTLVFAIAPNVPVRQVIADIARPGIMIWDRIVPNLRPFDPDGSIRVETDPSSPRLEEMVRDYYWEYELSNDVECIRNARVYVRKPEQPQAG
ncbi:hypothetical protein QBC35DRAFT_471252 [Podospora australis]|uniref:SRR1-like domain-containing protein n=1 Tax=Podospora australis TaxID=1536484 RepID=A0AAN6X077_9PEZI|nr:hypothetical protein QBC35DRAFT_471252 [Podospora australis]